MKQWRNEGALGSKLKYQEFLKGALCEYKLLVLNVDCLINFVVSILVFS